MGAAERRGASVTKRDVGKSVSVGYEVVMCCLYSVSACVQSLCYENSRVLDSAARVVLATFGAGRPAMDAAGGESLVTGTRPEGCQEVAGRGEARWCGTGRVVLIPCGMGGSGAGEVDGRDLTLAWTRLDREGAGYRYRTRDVFGREMAYTGCWLIHW